MIENSGGAAFLQEDHSDRAANLLRIVESFGSHYLSVEKRATVTSFLESSVGGKAPELSAGVAELLGILKSMKDEMQADHDEMSKDEHSAAVAYQEMSDSKGQSLKLLAETILDKQKREGQATLALAEDKDSLDDTNEELANAQKYLKQLQDACETKASQRDTRAKMRNDEITALSEAIEILSSDDATAAGKKATGNEALIAKKTHKSYWALIQKTVTSVSKSTLAKKMPFLKLLAVKSETHVKAASRDLFRDTRPAGVDESAGAATKVVNFMIDNMVEVLHDDDDEHKKEFCFNETHTMTRLQEEKTLLEENLNTSVAEMNEHLTALNAEIKELEDTIDTQDQDVLKA